MPGQSALWDSASGLAHPGQHVLCAQREYIHGSTDKCIWVYSDRLFSWSKRKSFKVKIRENERRLNRNGSLYWVLKNEFRKNVMSGVRDVYYSRLGSPRSPGGVLEMVHRTFWLKQTDQIKKQTWGGVKFTLRQILNFVLLWTLQWLGSVPIQTDTMQVLFRKINLADVQSMESA